MLDSARTKQSSCITNTLIYRLPQHLLFTMEGTPVSRCTRRPEIHSVHRLQILRLGGRLFCFPLKNPANEMLDYCLHKQTSPNNDTLIYRLPQHLLLTMEGTPVSRRTRRPEIHSVHRLQILRLGGRLFCFPLKNPANEMLDYCTHKQTSPNNDTFISLTSASPSHNGRHTRFPVHPTA